MGEPRGAHCSLLTARRSPHAFFCTLPSRLNCDRITSWSFPTLFLTSKRYLKSIMTRKMLLSAAAEAARAQPAPPPLRRR